MPTITPTRAALDAATMHLLVWLDGPTPHAERVALRDLLASSLQADFEGAAEIRLIGVQGCVGLHVVGPRPRELPTQTLCAFAAAHPAMAGRTLLTATRGVGGYMEAENGSYAFLLHRGGTTVETRLTDDAVPAPIGALFREIAREHALRLPVAARSAQAMLRITSEEVRDRLADVRRRGDAPLADTLWQYLMEALLEAAACPNPEWAVVLTLSEDLLVSSIKRLAAGAPHLAAALVVASVRGMPTSLKRQVFGLLGAVPDRRTREALAMLPPEAELVSLT